MSYQQQGNHRKNQQNNQRQPISKLDTTKIKFSENETLSPDLFDGIAHQTAKTISEGRSNESTQMRKFYEEIVMWNEKTTQNEDKFDEYLPFIRMLNAKAAYAQGRKHVDQNFVDLMACCLKQVSSVKTMQNFKYFFEAFIGFYKIYKQK